MGLSRITPSANVPATYEAGTIARLFRQFETLLNSLAEGLISARYQARTTIPTTGSFVQGDIVWKSDPVEAGAGGSKYVIIGWVCTVSGTPGTLLQMRVLTGN